MASIEMSQIGEDACDVREHARLVHHPHAQVIGGLHFAHRQNRDIGKLVGLKCEMRYAMLWIGGDACG